MSRKTRTCLAGVFVVSLCVLGANSVDGQDTSGVQAVFQDEVRVEVVDMLVSVVDSIGEPVNGLAIEDFQVFHDGEEVELTFFSDEGYSGGQTLASGSPGVEQGLPPHRLILIFDRISLEKKARKRTLKGLEDFLSTELVPGTRVMIALAGGGVEVIQPFTGDLKEINTALAAVNEVDFSGDSLRGRKRVFARTMSNAQTMPIGAFKDGNSVSAADLQGMGIEDSLGTMQADGYKDQVNRMRDYEFNRILGALIDLETIVRGTAGTTGRRDIVWVGEDLFIKPGIDSYTPFFETFQNFSTQIELEHPEIWAKEKELVQQFEAVAKMCQGMGATVHILDASDRTRYSQEGLMDRDRQTGLVDKFDFGDNRNMTFRQDGAQAQNLVEGGRFLSNATGGASLSGSRDVDEFFELLGAIIGGTYWVGYTPPDGLDGQLHDVAIGIKRKGLMIYSAQRVPAETVHHRLADLASAEMLLPQGENPLGFEVQAGESETRDDGKVIQTFRLVLPTRLIRFAEEGEQRTARLAVGVVMRETDGEVKPASVFQLPVSVPAERFREGSKVASSFRLLVDDRLERVSIALRDQLSGVSGCQTLSLVTP